MYYVNIPFWDLYKKIKTDCSSFSANDEQEYGFLNVNVFRYVMNVPLADASVRVSKLTIGGLYRERGVGIYLETHKSDKSGMVPEFKLPVLKNEDAVYIISVQSPGYHTAYVMDVPIYPDITTTYNIYPRHHTLQGTPDYEFILQPQLPGREPQQRLNGM